MISGTVSKLAACILPLAYLSAAYAASPATVTGTIDDQALVTLGGNTRPEARLTNDRGKLAGNFPLDHLQLLLKRPPETEAALKDFIDSLHDRTSSHYHQWLTAGDFGAKFGPAPSDIAAVTGWLSAHGFAVNGVAAGGMTIDFSGTAASVQSAFHTEMHRLAVGGVSHIANMSDPQIPQALSGVVAGVVSLNDFRPHTNYKPRPAYTVSGGGHTYHIVVPADLATIYNLNPLFAAGISGQGQTVVVLEDTNVHSTADFTSFRDAFGLSTYSAGSFTQLHPAGSNACANPGVVAGADGEAALDMEWASAAAPSAAIELASCKDTATNFGGLLALQNLINGANPPAIVSLSYGECEVENGATANAAFNTTYQQAVALGVSVFVSAGDEGAASCDADLTKATHGIAVSAYASTPYNVAVGGTDFGDTYAGTTATYWRSTNTTTYGSALSYINEIPWNDSCASVLLATSNGYSTTYGATGFCNSSTGKSGYLTTASGSGGPSGCATGKASTSGVVSGTCKGYAKPSWQKLVGVSSDGVRDIPDVSLFAANGYWAQYYAYCDSNTTDGGSRCKGAPVNWSGGGGTSFGSPILAGIQALVNQKTGSRQGNPNTVYYKLAATEYGASGSAACNSTKGNAVSTSCIFYDVRQGDMDVNCTGTHNCYKPSGPNGVLSTSDSSYLKAYGTSTGWDFATGIGSVNAANLVNNW